MNLKTASVLLFSVAIVTILFGFIQETVYLYEISAEIMLQVFFWYFLASLVSSVSWLLTGISYSKSNYSVSFRRLAGIFMIIAGTGHFAVLIHDVMPMISKEQYGSYNFIVIFAYQITYLFSCISMLILGISLVNSKLSWIRIAMLLVMINFAFQSFRIGYTIKTSFADSSMPLDVLNMLWGLSLFLDLLFIAVQCLWAYKVFKNINQTNSQLIDRL